MVTSTMIVTLPYPIADIWQRVTDCSNQSWRRNLSKFEKIDDNHFIEYNKDGIPTHFTVTKSVSQKIWQLEFHNQMISGTWTGEFTTQHGRTHLCFTENVVVKNHFLSPLVWIYLKTQQMKYFRDLKRALT